MLEKRTIRIAQGQRMGPANEPIYGWKETPALCEGGLAVHRGGARFAWGVTHESSGLALDVLGAQTRARALANMAAALALPFDWSRDEASTKKALMESRGLVPALRAIGASD